MKMIAVTLIACLAGVNAAMASSTSEVVDLLEQWELDHVFKKAFVERRYTVNTLLSATQQAIDEEFPNAWPLQRQQLYANIQKMKFVKELVRTPRRLAAEKPTAKSGYTGLEIKQDKAFIAFGEKADINIFRDKDGTLRISAGKGIALDGPVTVNGKALTGEKGVFKRLDGVEANGGGGNGAGAKVYDTSKIIGKTIALWSPTHKRFVRMHATNANMDKSAERIDATLGDNWTWELFNVVDAGDGHVALFSPTFKRFVRMPTADNMDKSAEVKDGTLPKDWSWEVFKVIEAGDGMVAFWNPTHKRFIRMPTGAEMDKSAVVLDATLPKDWSWEVFRIIDTKPGPHSLVGKTIALWSPTHKRFVRMPTGDLMDKSAERADGTLPAGWTWEMFKVVDGGDGRIALWNPTHKRFMRLGTGANLDKSAERKDATLGDNWTWEVFNVVNVDKGLIALYSPLFKRFVRMPTGTNMDKSAERPDGTLGDDWTWEIFKVVDAGNPPKPKPFDPKKYIGKHIALWSPLYKSFVRMPTGTNMDKSGVRADGTLPDDWQWEVFKVVDAKNGLIALYNPTHKRYVRMPTGTNMDKSAVTDGKVLPNGWVWEMFKVVDAGDGMIALWNPTHKRFVRMNGGSLMDKSGERPDGTLGDNWTWEVFKVVDAKPQAISLIGKTIALWNPTFKRFVRMPTGTLMDRSGERPDGTLPSGWTWEQFKVQDAGNGLIALWNPTHKRYVRMPTGTNMDKSGVTDGKALPNGWVWEMFKIVNLGNGQIALWNPTHKRFVRMNGGTHMDKSGERPDGTLGDNWTWEVFTVVTV